MAAIILDGQLKSALCVVRSLGRAGVTFSVGAERPTGMALHSRYTHARFTYPSPYTHQDEFVLSIKREAERLGGRPVVYAFSDATYLSLFTHRTDLCEYVTLIFPRVQSVEIAFDKAATYSLARVSGVPTIQTYAPASEDEINRVIQTITYPAVIKTRKSVTWQKGNGVFGSASFVHTGEELREKFSELTNAIGEAPLIQDFLRGEEYGVEMLAQEGKTITQVVHHRIRSLSPTGGASVLKETVSESDLKNQLEEYAGTLVKKLEWSGPIMVEFKVDSDSREPKLMEINGRFWGSLPLAVAAGVDMPMLYYSYVTKGVSPEVTVTAREGVTTGHFLGDILHLVRVWFKKDAMRPVLYPKRMSALKDFLVPPKGTKDDVWSVRDMKPGIMEIVDTIKNYSWK